MSDPIVAYFCFPLLGIDVALHPGDILIFNPHKHRSVSLRWNNDHDIYCVSIYLKIAVARLNDNSLPLTLEQKGLVTEYKKNKKNK